MVLDTVIEIQICNQSFDLVDVVLLIGELLSGENHANGPAQAPSNIRQSLREEIVSFDRIPIADEPDSKRCRRLCAFFWLFGVKAAPVDRRVN